ncbi:Zinc finger and BTB domain-containing protein 8B [Halocaridina rubra]|uniref:Zinc finger and BTB domain-containing protein 8B n=1 Tax=Halocaridina rubra TaxID=373956 RepID=A0AAN8WB02_HALRR
MKICGARNERSTGGLEIIAAEAGYETSGRKEGMLPSAQSISGAGLKLHQCPYCSYSNLLKESVTRHIRTHTGEKPFPCPYCAAQFARRDILKQGGGDDVIGRCLSGPQRLTSGRLQVHQCPYCSYSSHREAHVIIHIRTHTGEKPFGCTYCSAQFKQKGQLNRHIRSHTGEKPYRCPICSQEFSRKDNLGSHMFSHRK